MESECFNNSSKQLHRTSSETMQCETRKKPKHLSKGPSFIKILGRDFSKQMRLPEEFTTNMNGYVPHRFIIESGMTKRCWRVEVEKDGDGRMFFRDGWAEFVEAHSLEVGNILLFEYEEQSIFQARVYDRNGCERTVIVDSKGDQIKPQKAVDDEDGEESEGVENEPLIVKSHQQKTRLAPKKYGRGIYKRNHTVPRSYKRTSKVSIGQSSSCFSFTIHYSKKHQFSQLTIPKAISLKMKLPSKDELKFQDEKGKVWTIKLAHRRDGRAICSQGWKGFMKDNKFAPGDKLKFDFISDEVVRFHVTKASKDARQSDDQVNGSLNEDCKTDTPSTRTAPNSSAIETITTTKRSKCESGNSFSCYWKDTTVRTYLYVPMSVVRGQNLLKKDSVVLRDPEGKCWPLEVKKVSCNRVVLTNGWVEFWKGHGLTTGDLLNFEFVSECLIKVSISHGKELLEPDTEGAVICMENRAVDNKDGVVPIEQVVTREEFDAAMNHEGVVTRDELVSNIIN
ncbi:B3 domain-containing protein REM10 [Bienertia sinuspersici]